MKQSFGLITIFALLAVASVGKVASAIPQQFTYKTGPALAFTQSTPSIDYLTQIKDLQTSIQAKIDADNKAREDAIEALQAQQEASYIVVPEETIIQSVYNAPSQPVQSDDYYVNWIIQHESGGNANSVNASSGACGLFQKIPCNVPLGDVAAQMADGLAYINSRYGSPANAVAFWQANGWY